VKMCLLLSLLTMVMAACVAAPSSEGREVQPAQSQCQDPRPQLCTMDYQPVCGSRDKGRRCITTPCNSTELHNYANACAACADAAVYSHYPGVCMGR